MAQPGSYFGFATHDCFFSQCSVHRRHRDGFNATDGVLELQYSTAIQLSTIPTLISHHKKVPGDLPRGLAAECIRVIPIHTNRIVA